MSVLAWITGRNQNLEREKKELKVELTQAIMKFERRRTEAEKVANDVMELMHRRKDENK